MASGNGLSPVRCQAITWTNTDLLSIGPLGTNFSDIWGLGLGLGPYIYIIYMYVYKGAYTCIEKSAITCLKIIHSDICTVNVTVWGGVSGQYSHRLLTYFLLFSRFSVDFLLFSRFSVDFCFEMAILVNFRVLLSNRNSNIFIQENAFEKCRLPKWRPSCPGGDELMYQTPRPLVALGNHNKPKDPHHKRFMSS